MANFLEKLKESIKKQPWIWAGAGLGTGAVLFVLIKERMAASSAAASSQQTNTAASNNGPLNGYGLDSLAGLPYAYYDPTMDTGTTSTQTTTSAPTTTTPGPLEGLIRAKETSGPYAGYDKHNPGVPLRNAPGGSQVAQVPFGGDVTISGAAISGPMNASAGTNIWYPVTYQGQNGYVSSADLANIFQQASGGGGINQDIGLSPTMVGWPG